MESIISEKRRMYETLLSFPPFFTLQEHEQSRRKQVSYWSELIHNYCRQNGIINSSVDEIYNLPIVRDDSSGIPKRLAKPDVVVVLKELEKLGCLDFQHGEKILISHFSPYQMADDLYRWAKENHLIGDVDTFKHISEGDSTTPRQKFYRQPNEVLHKCVDILEKQNKAVKIQMDYEFGVKFL